MLAIEHKGPCSRKSDSAGQAASPGANSTRCLGLRNLKRSFNRRSRRNVRGDYADAGLEAEGAPDTCYAVPAALVQPAC